MKDIRYGQRGVGGGKRGRMVVAVVAVTLEGTAITWGWNHPNQPKTIQVTAFIENPRVFQPLGCIE